MKNILLLVLSYFLALSSYSQSLELSIENNPIDDGDQLTINAHADSGMVSFGGLDVINTGFDPLMIKCAREVISEVSNTENSFSWGGSYPATTDTSVASVKIEAGESTSNFASVYYPNGNSGTTVVKYTFYDLGNPEDKISFIINYKATSESGLQASTGGMNFSPVYPNPANQVAKLDYSIAGNGEIVKFVLLDLFGSIVKEIEITDNSGSLALNTSGFTEGIYFYSLLINNESYLTHKLIIKH